MLAEIVDLIEARRLLSKAKEREHDPDMLTDDEWLRVPDDIREELSASLDSMKPLLRVPVHQVDSKAIIASLESQREILERAKLAVRTC